MRKELYVICADLVQIGWSTAGEGNDPALEVEATGAVAYQGRRTVFQCYQFLWKDLGASFRLNSA